ncbi:MAG: DUF721 domain-containing protein [Bacteroidales bacterium]|jgi:hypothetical protein|nr:DUF721 domain-containing protein [Bacteroidales bacterium]
MKRTNANILSDLLKEFIRDEGLEEGLLRLRIANAWDKIVGKKYAYYTSSRNFANGILYCTISSSIVRNQLYFQLDNITLQLNKELGDNIIKKIILR